MGCVVIQILWLTQGGNCMANKEYKSDVFSMLLQDKKRAMEIYNAINGTDYDDPELWMTKAFRLPYGMMHHSFLMRI